MFVAIVGSGMAGLAAARHLQQADLDVTVLEAARHVGGVVCSTRRDGYLIEHGPNSIQGGSPALDDLLHDLGLESQTVEAASAARRRYIVKDGVLVPLPSGPLPLLTTDLLTARGKLRLLREPFVRPAAAEAEESVAAFIRRRLGPEVLDYAVDPFVAGIFAGDPAALSVRHAFPRLYGLEQQHGSLLRGLSASARGQRRTSAPRTRRQMFSFEEGIQTIPHAIASQLGERVRTGATVTSVQRNGGGWQLSFSTGEGESENIEADAVLFTTPLHRLGRIAVDGLQPFASLADVHYAPIRVAAMGYRAEAVQHPLDGFGLLVPSTEGSFRILGALFSSTLFPNRAPEGHVLLTVFMGGEREPELAYLDDDMAERIAHADLSRLLGISEEPAFTAHIQWTHAIPQYVVGYGAVKDELDRLEEIYDGLFFAGNFRNGISVADTVATAAGVAGRIEKRLQGRARPTR